MKTSKNDGKGRHVKNKTYKFLQSILNKYILFQIKKFNLELCLFAKELNSYTETVNEIDDETTKLLIEIILAVDHLQASSKNHKKLASNENQFISYLDEGIFKVRRCIVCHLCHVSSFVNVKVNLLL